MARAPLHRDQGISESQPFLSHQGVLYSSRLFSNNIGKRRYALVNPIRRACSGHLLQTFDGYKGKCHPEKVRKFNRKVFVVPL